MSDAPKPTTGPFSARERDLVSSCVNLEGRVVIEKAWFALKAEGYHRSPRSIEEHARNVLKLPVFGAHASRKKRSWTPEEHDLVAALDRQHQGSLAQINAELKVRGIEVPVMALRAEIRRLRALEASRRAAARAVRLPGSPLLTVEQERMLALFRRWFQLVFPSLEHPN